MRLKVVSVLSAVALMAACSSTPDQESTATGGGTQTTAQQTEVESQTQPMGPAAGTVEDFMVNVGDRVFFAFDSSALDARAQSLLQAQAAWLRSYPSVTITVEGHCDERGTREYNLALGDRRASAVKDYLVALGVAPGRVATVSFGKERPVALGHNDAAWSQNRRAVSTLAGVGS